MCTTRVPMDWWWWAIIGGWCRTPVFCRNSKCSQPLRQLYPPLLKCETPLPGWPPIWSIFTHLPDICTYSGSSKCYKYIYSNIYGPCSFATFPPLTTKTQWVCIYNQHNLETCKIKYWVHLHYFSTATTRNVEHTQGRPLGFYACLNPPPQLLLKLFSVPSLSTPFHVKMGSTASY